MSDVILKLENLSKSFRSQWTFRSIPAVHNVSLEVYRGESFGFLGHNGAGKTTTIKTIVGLIHKSSGEIYLNGEKFTHPEQRQIIGYLPELPYFYDHLTVAETLEFFAALHGIDGASRTKQVNETLELVSLADRKRSAVRSLSKGLQQRLALGQAIINKPQLLFLDEPFSGLDPIGRLEVRELIQSLKLRGTTLFMSSHILSDVEEICDRVAIMARGELRSVFNLSDKAELFGQSFELVVREVNHSAELLSELAKFATHQAAKSTSSGESLTLRFPDYGSAQKAMAIAMSANAQIEDFRSCGLSLEQIFVSITEAKN